MKKKEEEEFYLLYFTLNLLFMFNVLGTNWGPTDRVHCQYKISVLNGMSGGYNGFPT